MEGGRKRRGWLGLCLWATFALTALAPAYALSVGPAVWVYHSTDYISYEMLERIYYPLLYVEHQLPNGIQEAFQEYRRWWRP